MLQELFHIPGTHIAIYGYGLMLVIGFLLAMELAKYLARRRGLDPETFVNAALIALLTGIVGARLSHVLENLSTYTRSDLSVGQNLLNIVNIRSGGLTYYGGFLLAFPTLVLYAIYKSVPLRTGMDIIAPCLMIGLGFGRIGCFLNGCCYGAQCDLPWAVRFPYDSAAYVDQYEHVDPATGKRLVQPPPQLTEMLPSRPEPVLKSRDEVRKDGLQSLASRERALPVHPAQLYSTITALLIALICYSYSTVPHQPGHVFALMCLLEGPTRFLLEALRVEPPQVGPLSLSMFLGIVVFLVGVALWYVFRNPPSRAEQRLYAPVP